MKKELNCADMFLFFISFWTYVNYTFTLGVSNHLQSGTNINEAELPMMHRGQRSLCLDTPPYLPSDARIPDYITEESDRLLRLYTRDTELGALATSLTDMCPEWIPCLNIAQLYNLFCNIGCCVRCHCDEYCSSTRSCCPGFEPNITTKEVEGVESDHTTCIKTALFTRNTNILREAAEYMMVTGCPTGTPIDLQQKCMALVVNNKAEPESMYAFSDIIPVTDTDTGVNFQNRHCAACHGVAREAQILWKAKYACDYEGFSFKDQGMLEEFIQTTPTCHLLLIAPDHVIANATRCYNDVEVRCNVTGRWGKYDHVIEKHCNSTDWLYEIPYSKKRYRNVFCALCNGEDFSNSLCQDGNTDNTIIPFSAVLNFNRVIEATDISLGPGGTGCPLGQLFDPVRVSCQVVVCSFPLMLDYVRRECTVLYDSPSYGLTEVPLVQVLVRPVHTEYVFPILAELNFITYPITKRASCTFYDVYVKLDTTYNALVNKGYIQTEKIISVYTMAVVNLRLPIERSHAQIKDTFLNTSMSVMDSLIFFEINTNDLYFLPPTIITNITEDGKGAEGTPIRMEIAPDHSAQYAAYEDPYDGAAVLYLGKQSAVDDVRCDTPFFLYDRAHFECPSFLYDTERARITRMTEGILLDDYNIVIPFGKFKSLNSTHIAICIDALQDIPIEARSYATNPRFSLSLSIVCVWLLLWFKHEL